MRFAAIDAEHRTGVEDLLDLCARTQADRVFLFRAAAAELAARTVQTRKAHDDRYLDDVERFLLAGPPGAEPPERRRDDPRLGPLLCVVPASVELVGLPATDRAVEMLDTRIGMAVPDRSRLVDHDDDLGNATFWIAGGTSGVELSPDRPWVLSPGALDAGGRVLVVEVERRALRVDQLDGHGELVTSGRLSLEPQTRLSVRG